MVKRSEAKGLPGAIHIGVDADRFAQAVARWRDSGYDVRLAPYAWSDEATQRYYDLYDAWANRGYEDDSEYWPPRTLRCRLRHGWETPDAASVAARCRAKASTATSRMCRASRCGHSTAS